MISFNYEYTQGNNLKFLAYVLSQNILSFLKIFSILFELF